MTSVVFALSMTVGKLLRLILSTDKSCASIWLSYLHKIINEFSTVVKPSITTIRSDLLDQTSTTTLELLNDLSPYFPKAEVTQAIDVLFSLSPQLLSNNPSLFDLLRSLLRVEMTASTSDGDSDHKKKSKINGYSFFFSMKRSWLDKIVSLMQNTEIRSDAPIRENVEELFLGKISLSFLSLSPI